MHDSNLPHSFSAVLLLDVADALIHYRATDDQTSKRNLVRVLFTAIEGFIWIFREHISDAAQTLETIDPSEQAVLNEVSYHVDAKGRIYEQTRFIPMLTMFRFIARLSEKISPETKVDFSSAGWEQLRSAQTIRNRITHPKSTSDLRLDDEDVAIAIDAFYWAIEALEDAMDAVNVKVRSELIEFNDIITKLRSGDPTTLNAYRAMKVYVESESKHR
ncbi:hypothetical protein IDJ81_06520 [Tsuneonella flava]|uniref:RiboL-PSP-HEPN domain-containing protein n=1 Tax=Tsuneonella flava TaxID=2055955 RepID=A0ABX7KEJ6_9SPHN|nr:hypothetical protein [Tsuneonella flava]QSB45746.1 hypothetical protein IDJ81_06520 [Tsuneonella flava]